MSYEEYAALPKAVVFDKYMESMHGFSLLLSELRGRIRWKPVVGGCFGHSGFVVVSHWVIRNNLDDVSYYVGDAESMFLFSRGDTQVEAISFARLLLNGFLTPSRLRLECTKFRAAAVAAEQEREKEALAKREAHIAEVRAKCAASGNVRSIPRRRKQIFAEADGKCHYCGTALTLDGKWHIEHKHPKALGGTNEPNNLVASCVPCNMKKRDTTDVEFKARLAKSA